MIQRIQSVYFLLVAILMSVTAFSPLLDLLNTDNQFKVFYSIGIATSSLNPEFPAWGVITFAGLAAIVALVNIFLYKKRPTQINLGRLTSFLIILFYATVGVYFYSFSANYQFTLSGMEYGIVLPFVALILNILGVLRVKKDEKLVKSLDRIR